MRIWNALYTCKDFRCLGSERDHKLLLLSLHTHHVQNVGTFKVSMLWAFASILVQHIADDIGFDQPFVFTYIGSGVMSTCVPAYLACASLGLVKNPPLRDETGTILFACVIECVNPVRRSCRDCRRPIGLWWKFALRVVTCSPRNAYRTARII